MVLPKKSAFNFHQAAERPYHCALLTLTLYSPKSRKLTFRRSQAEQLGSDRQTHGHAAASSSAAASNCSSVRMSMRSPRRTTRSTRKSCMDRRERTALQRSVESVCRERLPRLEQVPGE